MYFEAESNGIQFKVRVNEKRSSWALSVQKNEGDWKNFEISKNDFRDINNAISFMFEGQSYLVDVAGNGTEFSVYTRGSYRNIKIFNDEMLLHESLKSGAIQGANDQLTSGMPGKIIKIFVKPGDLLKKDDPIFIIEAMKMENEIRAAQDATVKEVMVTEGSAVSAGTVLITFS